MITSDDVYDVATSMRQELERLMSVYGQECVSQLVPKTVYVLELLEHVTETGQNKSAELEELHCSVERLKVEKETHILERDKYKKELEVLEECWKKELLELAAYSKQLQEEHHRLCGLMHDQNSAENTVMERSDVLLMERIANLREAMLQQCDELRLLRHELDEKNSEVEAMQSQIDRLLKLNGDCWMRTNLAKKHVEGLLQEVVDLQLSLKEKEQQIAELGKQLTVFENGSEKTGKANGSPQHMNEIDAELPQFTLGELRGVLNERNKLKIKLYEMEEELERLAPSSESLATIGTDICDMRSEAERPVQGPINREPDEKMLTASNGGKSSFIRRVFKNFLENFELPV